MVLDKNNTFLQPNAFFHLFFKNFQKEIKKVLNYMLYCFSHFAPQNPNGRFTILKFKLEFVCFCLGLSWSCSKHYNLFLSYIQGVL